MEGVIFFKDYLIEREENITQFPRFKDLYISELIELLNEEEAYIRIEALEILAHFLKDLEPPDVEAEFVKELLHSLEADIEDIQIRMGQILGLIVHKLKPFGLHIKHRAPIIKFYKTMLDHINIKIKRSAAFNLPCFNQLFKEF